MAEYSQANRPARVDTVLDEDALLLAGFSGSEGISAPFAFHLDLLSEDPAIDAQALLRTPAVISLATPDGEERAIHGLIRRFVQLERHDELTSYQAEIVPWLWFLSLSRDCKVFQNLSVLEIVEQVFQSQGYADFEIQCTRTYPKREYCVQYRETHLNFVSRLLEEEGIFYFFEHSDSKHVMKLADGNSAMEACPGFPTARIADEGAVEEDVVTELQREHAVYVGTVTLKDYDHLQPSLSLESSMSGDGGEEVYDYPGGYTELDEGDRYARLQLEAEEALRQTARGAGTCRAFRSGATFDLEDHYRAEANRTYLLIQAQHFCFAADYRARDGGTFRYHNHFLAIPNDVPFRPSHTTPKPVVRGSQTAVVVGPAGEEVWVDKYGRVKVQFYWDRIGTHDENSSCWVRVATPWGGKGYGGVSIPRIGNEVIVDFLEGDPDRPIITASVYNADQMPPLPLPASGIQMGMKSRSSPGGGGYNEITMTDTKGKEQITVHGQYDMNTTVEHDQTTTVHNDQTSTIDNNRTENVGANESITIGGDRTEQVDGSESITVTLNRTRNVGINESVNIGVAQEVTIGGMQAITVGVNQTTNVGRDQSASVGGNQSAEIKKNQDCSVGSNRSAQVSKNDTLKVGKKLLIDAGDEITIKTGQASITLKKNGDIKIQGKNIEVSAMQEIKLKGTKIATEAKTTNLTKGAMVNSEASGINTIKGSLVKIN